MLLDADGALTPVGMAARQQIEDHTDGLAMQPLRAISEAQLARLTALASRVGRQIIAAGGVPFPNPMGLPDQLSDAASQHD